MPVHTVTTADVSHRSDSEEHQGICAEADGYPYVTPPSCSRGPTR